MRHFRPSCIAFCLAALLTACGGGGGGSSGTGNNVNTTAINGVAVDGYLESATAFADCNNDGILGSDEASANTNAQGQFTLNLTSAQTQCRIVVKAIAGVTKDTGTTITQDFKLLTPPPGTNASIVVSPLTTQVVAALAQNNNDVAAAQTAVRTALGLSGNINVMADFVALKNSSNANASEYAQAHNLAMAITQVLQDVAAQNTDLNTALTTLRTTVATVFTPNNLTALKNAANRTAVLNALSQATTPNNPPTNPGITFGSLAATLFDPVAKQQTLTASYANNSLTFATTALLNKANLLQLVDGSGKGTIPTLTLPSTTAGELTTSPSNITISLTGTGVSLSTTFAAAFANTPPRLLLPAQTIEIRSQGMINMTKSLDISSQTLPLLAVTEATHTAAFNALNLITLLDGKSFNIGYGTLAASDILNLLLTTGAYTLTIDLGNSSQLYTSTGQIKTIQLPIRLN